MTDEQEKQQARHDQRLAQRVDAAIRLVESFNVLLAVDPELPCTDVMSSYQFKAYERALQFLSEVI